MPSTAAHDRNDIAMTSVASSDRLGFTLFLAAAIHGLLIFGVGFELGKPSKAHQASL